MAKITLNNLTTNYGSQALFNANSDTIEDHLNNKVLYRDNPTGEPNTMENELDMNSNRIINLAAGVLNSDAVTVAQLNAITTGGTSTPVVSQSRETQLGSDATARVFTLAGLSYTVGANTLAVYRNGQRLERTEDYSETSSSSVTLTFDPNDSDRFVFITNDIGTSEVTTTGAITHNSSNLADIIDTATRYYSTMALAVAAEDLQLGQPVIIGDRANSLWDVVLSSGVTENTYNIVQCTGIGTFSLQLRVNESTDIKAFGVPGNDADYTAGIAAAIAATVNKKLLWSAGTYQSDSIVVPSNIHWIFDKNCTLKATTGYGSTEELLDFTSTTDFVLECNDAVFQMIKSEYTTGEHRHCFNLVNCTDGLIINPNAIDSGGDGYYVNGATRVTIVNPKADNNRRNGMSVIKATDLNVVGIAKFSDQTGTAPQSGLVIEPNSDADSLIRVNFETVEVTGNAADGLSIYLDDYKTGTPADVSININKLISRGNAGRAVRISNVFLNSGSYGGTINIGEVISDDDVGAAISIVDKSVSAPFLNIGKVTAWNPCTGASAFAETAAVYLGDTSATVSGGIHIGPVSARATHTDMDYGVICEMGGGFSDTRILVENVRGQQVTPVRLNNITYTIAEASDLIVQMSKLNETVALTTGTNIVATAHLGRVITNTGAAGSITLALREYPPIGNPYRFRVTEAQTMAIDTFDATDRIVGTTTAGATVTSNVVGAECEVSYLGTFGGVRYWKHNPIGPVASWTYN